jgi:hypothetical protein
LLASRGFARFESDVKDWGTAVGENDENAEAALQGLDLTQRAKLRRLLLKYAFVTPIVASFGMSALNLDAMAAAVNSTIKVPLPPG